MQQGGGFERGGDAVRAVHAGPGCAGTGERRFVRANGLTHRVGHFQQEAQPVLAAAAVWSVR
jgi:hypothetical protein